MAGASLAPQVCWEFLHVVTDERRFEQPYSMQDASALVRAVWNARETQRLPAIADVVPRVLDLLREHRLGRMRILANDVMVLGRDRVGLERAVSHGVPAW